MKRLIPRLARLALFLSAARTARACPECGAQANPGVYGEGFAGTLLVTLLPVIVVGIVQNPRRGDSCYGRGPLMNDGRKKQPTIFLIEEDDETRRPLVSNLRGYGYRVVVAVDEEDALDRVGGGGFDADLILVNLVGKTADEVLGVGRRVRQHARYDGHTPLVVMPEKYDEELEDTEVKVEGNDWIFYLGEDPYRLRELLARLTAVLRKMS